ncbi:preprotein translocase subunit SecG [Buchnera aphidicola]|uniref:preprotein translocase subunit SecG n=1 Tax=Buchnera aphidicola TaxID=9 RepID=UPI00346402AD
MFFIVISFLLIFLIMIQSEKNTNVNSIEENGINSIFNSYRKNNIVIVTSCIAAVFFIVALILCRIIIYEETQHLILDDNQKELVHMNKNTKNKIIFNGDIPR